MAISFEGFSQATSADSARTDINIIDTNEDIFIMAFPNPSKGLIQLNKTVKSIVVYDLDGRRLSYRKNNDQINLSHLKKGAYVLEINQSKTMVVNINP